MQSPTLARKKKNKNSTKEKRFSVFPKEFFGNAY
jgi:hypothetical protein